MGPEIAKTNDLVLISLLCNSWMRATEKDTTQPLYQREAVCFDSFRRDLKTMLIFQTYFKLFFDFPHFVNKFSLEHENTCKLGFPGHNLLVVVLPAHLSQLFFHECDR